MSVTGLDNRQEMQTAATAAAKANKADGKSDTGEDASAAAVGAPDFAALLQGRLGRNMALTRADAQLTAPERAATNDQAATMRDGRARDPGFDGAKRDEPPAAARNEPARDAARPTRDGENAPARPRANTDADAGARADRQADAPAAPTKQSAGTAARDGAARAGDTPADTAAARAAAPDAAARQAAAEAKQQTAQARAAGDLPAKVQVTQQPAQLASQPQSTLGAASAVAAETARGAQAKADGPATPEEMLQSLRTGQPGSADGDAAPAANKSSAANPAAQAAKAQAAAKAAGQQGQGQAAQGQAAQGQADAGAGQAQAAPAPTGRSASQPGAASGLQTALEAGGRVASLSGAGKPSVSADPMTGGTALSGQNNAVSQRSAPPQAAQTARQTPLPTPVADQVAVQIQKAAQAGGDKITVQLRPAELGRVEVKMEVAHDGRLTAVVTADKAETLDMLRQDARQLLQTLNDAGLKADQQSLSFNLRGQQADGGAGEGGKNGGGARGGEPEAPADSGRDPFDDVGEIGGFTADGRLNLRV